MPRPRILLDKICPVCSKSFRPSCSIVKHCSFNCSRQNRPLKGNYKNCKICGKNFYTSQCFKNTSKYCSKICQLKSLEKPETWTEKKCKLCGEKYKVRKCQIRWRGSNFCSFKCFMKFKKTKYKKRKKTKNSIVKKILWKFFSQYIRQRDDGICISCGKKDFWRKMDAGHYIPKTAGLSLYFDEKNVNCQCTYCNRWMHGNLAPYAIALRKKYGEKILEELDKQRNEIKKISISEYENMIETYKVKLQEFEKD